MEIKAKEHGLTKEVLLIPFCEKKKKRRGVNRKKSLSLASL